MATPSIELNMLKKELKVLVRRQDAAMRGEMPQSVTDEIQKQIDEIDTEIANRERTPEFAKMLDICTSHVSDKTRKFLETADLDEDKQIEGVPVRMVSHKYGWVMWPMGVDADAVWTNAPELKAINDFAFKAGCILVNFEAEADTNDRFPTYEW